MRLPHFIGQLTIRGKLSVVVLACALPSVISFTLLVQHFYEREKTLLQRESIVTARALSNAVDREIDALTLVGKALAAAPTLRDGDFRAAHAQASALIGKEFPGYRFVLRDPRGRQLFSTERAFGDALTDPEPSADAARVFSSGKPVVSNLFVGAAGKRDQLAIHLPVLEDGNVKYCLSVGLLPAQLSEILQDNRLPANRVVGIIDANGLLVARTRDMQKFLGTPIAPALFDTVLRAREGVVATNTLDNVPVYSMYSRSPTTGWTVMVGVPRKALLTELLVSLVWVTVPVLLMFFGGFGIALFLAARISGAVRDLSARAVALGKGISFPPTPSSFKEASFALSTLKNVDAELVRHRSHLENLIVERTRELNIAVERLALASAQSELSNTLLRESEQLARENEERIRAVVDTVGEGIITIGDDGKIESFNRAASDIFGYTQTEIVGADIQQLMPPNMRHAHSLGMKRFNAGGQPAVVGKSRVELPGLHKSGTVFLLELAINVIKVEGRNLFVGIVRDITEQKQASEKLKEATQQAQLANNAKSIFVANMSHELRTPLNAVIGMAHLLGKTSLTTAQRRDVDMICTAGKTLLGIINNILDFSKIEAGKIETMAAALNLDDVLQSVAVIMSAAAGPKDLALAIGVDPDVPMLLVGDALRLEQVLVNLVGNAVKFTSRGEVSLQVELVARSGDSAQLRFTVRDTGIGISAQQQEHLFSAFSQADVSITRRFGGTGLGLAIARSLVELLGGTLSLRSEEGLGSEFSFTMRFGLAQCRRQGGIDALPQVHRRVLVVDDNATSRAFLSKAVQACGWEADSVASSEALLERFDGGDEDVARVDVILVDLRLPGGGGLATVQTLEARALRQRPSFVIMATADQKARLLEQQRVLPYPVLTKPVTATSMQAAISEALEARGAGTTGSGLAPKREMKARILLVEDNAINQQVACRILEETGAFVDAVDNGHAAVTLLESRVKRYDLILMDIQMPVMDGYTATALIRTELGLDTPILAMTAGVMQDEREKCFACGMNGFIAKPVDPALMLQTIADFIPIATAPAVAAPAVVSSGVFDVSKLMAVARDDQARRATTVALIRKMRDSGAESLADIREAWQQQRYDALGRLLHSARGMVGTLGAKRLVAASLLLEEALRRSPDAQLGTLFSDMEREFEATLAEAACWLQAQTVTTA